jgi:hypothetical protein
MERAAAGGAGAVATATPPLVITGADIAIDPASAIAAGSMSAADFTKLATYAASTTSGWQFFGLGTDGAVTISANTTASGNYYPSTLTVNTSSRLSMASYAVYCSVSCTVEAGSFISNNGAPGLADGTAGAALAVGTLHPATTAGGAGGTAAGSASSAFTGPSGRGGAGGAGSGGAGGSAGARTSLGAARGGNSFYNVAHQSLNGLCFHAGATSLGIVFWAGGGGGGGGDGVAGGGGGAGAGGLVVCSPLIANGGSIECNGGDGGTPAAGNRGGGGPGGGGGVITLARSRTGAGTYQALKGTPGTGSGTGANGSIATAQDGLAAAFTC